METCNDCQKPIEPGQTSYVSNPATGVIHHYHSKCGDPFGIKRAVAEERERCAKIAEDEYRDDRWHGYYRQAGTVIAGIIRQSHDLG